LQSPEKKGINLCLIDDENTMKRLTNVTYFYVWLMNIIS